MKNKRIRKAMTDAEITQVELAGLMNTNTAEVSIVLNKYELAVREQNEIVKRIREHDAQKRGIHHEPNAV